MRKRFPRHTCNACSRVCPVQAITLESHTLSLDADACIRCGHCLFACPVDALENLQPAARQYRDDALVEPLSPQPAGADELLMWHLQLGIRAVEVDIDEHPGWALSVAALNIRLKALGEPLWQIRPPAPRAVNVLRRHWLRVNDDQAQSARVQASQRLRRSAWTNRCEHRLTLDPAACILCGACERVCEEKAITLSEGEMTLTSSRCTGCDNCAVACPTKAIKTEAQAGECQSERVRYVQKVCACCQREFSTFNAADERCPLCQRHQYGMRG